MHGKFMSKIVMKFGGTSVANIERINASAQLVKQEKEKGNQIIVVVSAMSGVTNQLIEYVNQANADFCPREYDKIVSTGEQVTAGLMALTLQSFGFDAISLTGKEAGMLTTDDFTKARIEEIDPTVIDKHINDGKIVVITGFQGGTIDGEITTLGRGGSDTSAVAFAAATSADRCDIYTDVDGIYTTDPRMVSDAKRLPFISHNEMLELASMGAKVLQTRSVEIAMKYGVPLRVVSSFDDINQQGTSVINEDDIMEKKSVVGIASNASEALITILGVENKPGALSSIFKKISQEKINVDMIIQTPVKSAESLNIAFTVAKEDLKKCEEILNDYNFVIDANIAKISIVGVGMRSNIGVADAVFSTISEKSINMKGISTSEIKISILIDKDYEELAVRSLHSAFELDK